MSPVTIGIIGIIVMAILLLLGMNIGIAFAVTGFLGFWILADFNAAIGLFRTQVYATATSYTYAVIPMFILMGNIALYAGFTGGLFECARKWMGRLPGGLADAAVVACACFGAICGSLFATCATMGAAAYPEMRKHNYDGQLATGVIAAGGTLGVLIPPSTPFIIYAISANTTVGEQFAAGIIPGVLMAVLFCAVIIIMVKRNPELAPKCEEEFTKKEKMQSLIGLIPIVLIFVVILLGMFTGLFSITESAAISAGVALIIMAVTGKMTWNRMKLILKDTLITTAMTFLLIIGASVLSNFLSISQLPSTLARTVRDLNMPLLILLLLMVILYLVMGCFMGMIEMILLTVPIFYPILTMYGVDPLWYGVLLVIVGQIGCITPPVGAAVFIIGGIAKEVPMTKIFKGSIPFILAMLATVAIIIIFPATCTWIPGIMY